MTYRKFLIIWLCLLSLGGCSTTFVYNNLPWLSHYWLDDYVDLNNQQTQQFKNEIEKLRTWHRTEELPKYQQQLALIKQTVLTTNEPSQFLMWRQQTEAFWQTLVEQAKDPLVELALTLSFEQKQQFIENLTNKINQQVKVLDKKSDADLIEERVERVTDNFNDWLGKLTSEQKSLIKQNVLATQLKQNLWLDYKQQRLAALTKLFLQPTINETQFRLRLTDIIINPDQFKSDQLLALSAWDKQQNAALQHTLISTLTKKQQQHLMKEFDKWYKDIESIANEQG